MRPHGRLVVNPRNPQASAVCQRCGMFENLSALQWQYQWTGTELLNTNLLFCKRCLDTPNPQQQARIIPPDPLPVLNARIEDLNYDNTGPVQSTMSSNVTQGATLIPVVSSAGFVVGNNVNIQMSNGAFAFENLTGVDLVLNTLTIASPLPFTAPSGGVVTVALGLA